MVMIDQLTRWWMVLHHLSIGWVFCRRLLAVVIMVLGLTLFLRLLRAITLPGDKVDYPCEACGLTRHDPDAVHCKHCGTLLKIETRGIE